MPLKKVWTCVFAFAMCFASVGQDIVPTKGKEFWVGFMENFEVEFTEELNLFIVSDQSTTGVVEIPNQGWSAPFTVNPNQTTTVTVPNNIAEHFNSEVVENKGVFVSTQDTVAVFAINFNGFTADATKILPVNSLGIDYRISSYVGLGDYGSEFLIVATEDGTEVEITPSGTTLGGNTAGVPFTVQLDSGESYQVQGAFEEDLTGTTIVGTEASGDCRPFAVFSGVSCANIPVGCSACDHIVEQNFSVDTWGTEFYAVPFSFADSYTLRVLADEDNTTVNVDSDPPFVLNAGEYIEFNDVPDVRCINADKGISVTQYMEGVGCGGAGDPAMLILNDASQKIDNITFSTVDSDVITEHGLNVILSSTDIGTLTLDGVVVPSADFTQFPNCPSHSYAQIDLTEGSHTLSAPNGCTGYVYGTGNAESYAYSVGSFSITEPLPIDTVLCQVGQVNLGVTEPWNSIYWYGQSAPEDTLGEGPNLTLIPPYNTDIYVAVGQLFASGCEQEQFFSVENVDPPSFDVFPTTGISICQFEDVQLGVDLQTPGTYFYTWSPSNTLSDPNINDPIASPLVTTTYEVLVSSFSGCSVGTDSLTIEVESGNVTNFEITSPDEDICSGENTTLELVIEERIFEDNFDPNISWGLWEAISGGSAGSGCGSISENALFFNGNGDRFAESVDVNLNQGGSVRFAIAIGSGSGTCDDTEFGDDVVLEYSINGGTDWELITTYFESSYPSFTIVEEEIPAGAWSPNTRFRWRQLDHDGTGTDNWSLDDISIGSENTNNYNITWTPSESLSSDSDPIVIASPLVTTTFEAVVLDNLTGCVYEDSLEINVGQVFSLDMIPDTILCDVQGIELFAEPSIPGDYDFEWSPANELNNPFSPTPTATPQATTTFEVQALSEPGCTASGEVEVVVNTLLSADVSTSDDQLCFGENTLLELTLGGNSNDVSIVWLPAESLDDAMSFNPTASPLGDTEYEVTVTDDFTGCVLTESIEIEVFDELIIDLGPDLDLCEVEGYQVIPTVNTTDQLSWDWQSAMFVDNSGSSEPTIVVNESLELIAIATNAADCFSSDTLQVNLLIENLDLGPDVTICAGDTLEISSGFEASIDHEWSTNETATSIEVSEAGLVSLELTSPEGCVKSDDIEVFLQALPVVDLGNDPGLCEGEMYQLDAGNPGLTHEWNTNESGQFLNVDENGIYSVSVTDNFNCVGEASIELAFYPNPVVELPEQASICEGDNVILDAGNAGLAFLWNTNDTTQTIETNIAGTYSVIVTNEFNCSNSDSTTLVVNDYPVVDLGPDLVACDGEIITLDAGNPSLIHSWSNAENVQVITVTESGAYLVEVDNEGCLSLDEVSVQFNALPIDPMLNDTILCFDDAPQGFLVNGQNPGASFLWSNGVTQRENFIDQPGVSSVLITTPNGCSQTFSLQVEEVCNDDFLYIPNAFTPNNDGLNDVFSIDGSRMASLKVTIWNRWGDIIFQSEDKQPVWNGSDRGGKYYVESEVYVYQVDYQYLDEDTGVISDVITIDGYVTLIR